MGLYLLFSLLCFHFFFLFHFPSFSFSSSLMPFCNHDQSSALLDFKNSFTLISAASSECVGYQSSYPKTKSWMNGTNCCLWDGITCDAMTGHVIGLDLSCSWLRGEFHPNSSLFQLIHLQRLNLAHNSFHQASIFSTFGGLTSLTHLNLSTSGFSGEIPWEISRLSKLVSLDLSYVYPTDLDFLTHNFGRSSGLRFEPSTWKNLISNLTDLRELVLDYVNMSTIRLSSLSFLKNFSSSLVSLDLAYTSLQGNLPNDIFCLPNLQEFRLTGDQNLRVQLPVSNWSTHLRYLDLSVSTSPREMLSSISHLKSLEHLNLYNCNLQGLIPPIFWNLTQLTFLSLKSNNFIGEIFSSLSNLQHLTYLDLSHNSFGGQLPNVFNQLSKLEYLSLSGNNFGGQLPSTLFNSYQLLHLFCSNNQLVGPIPNNTSVSLHLIDLDLSRNALNGTIPSWLFSLPSLLYLDLSNNQITGHISELPSNSLNSLYLSNNMLQGNIPNSIFELVNLTSLSLSTNNLSGDLGFHKFSNLSHLEFIDLSENHFLSLSFDNNVQYTIDNLGSLYLSACNINGFPEFIVSLQNLKVLDLSNNQIQGRVPKWFTNVGNGFLSYLNLSRNLLTSVEHLSLMNISTLDLTFNLLQDLPILPFKIEFFFVSYNKLRGNISSTICKASSLNILSLSHNNLTGLIPQCLGSMSSLSVLDLKLNKLSGSMPQSFSIGNALRELNFNENNLKGPLPQSLANCKELELLDLGNNNIRDTFPYWLQTLPNLQVLVLQGNKFHGAIMANIRVNHPFPKLRIFDISNNDFEGLLPVAYIKEFKGMMDIDGSTSDLQYMRFENQSSYVYSLFVTIKGNYIEMSRVLTTFTMVDMSNNKFEGEIPKVIGELESLKGLNLSHNMINGSIPESLGKLINLEWLDLSWNQLKGEIPSSLTNLNSLSVLNLSINHLTGMIPIGKQFNTFMNDSYMGNLGLCGFPMSKTCSNNQAQVPQPSSTFQQQKESGFTWKAVAQGYGCGMVFGIIIGGIVLKTGKPKWIARMVEGEPKRRTRRTRGNIRANHRRRN